MTRANLPPFAAHIMTLRELHRHWGWLLALGVVLFILGIVALGATVMATLASVLLFGWLLFFGGILQAAHALWSARWSGFFLHLLGGVFDVVVGLIMIANPFVGALSLTLLLAAFFTVVGLFRIVGAVTLRFRNWGWLLLSGIVSVILGILIWAQWPASSLWVIGTFVGIDLLFNGWWLIMLGMEARHVPEAAA